MKDIRLIIFDFDGTLGDTRQVIVTTMRQTMQELHYAVASEAACATTIGLPLKECFRRLLPDIDETAVGVCADTYRRFFDINKTRVKPVLFAHVAETVERLAQSGMAMTVASSRSTTSLHELLQVLGIAHCFSYVLGADEVVHAKPDPEPVLKTLMATGFDASQTLVVGDMPVDILMGRGAGCRTCGVTYGNGTREELLAAGADFVIDGMHELLHIFG